MLSVVSLDTTLCEKFPGVIIIIIIFIHKGPFSILSMFLGAWSSCITGG
jgi:hypothetical protein